MSLGHLAGGLLEGGGQGLSSVGDMKYQKELEEARFLRKKQIAEIAAKMSAEQGQIRREFESSEAEKERGWQEEQESLQRKHEKDLLSMKPSSKGGMTDQQYSNAWVEAREAYTTSPDSQEKKDTGVPLWPFDNKTIAPREFSNFLSDYNPQLMEEAMRRGHLMGGQVAEQGGLLDQQQPKETDSTVKNLMDEFLGNAEAGEVVRQPTPLNQDDMNRAEGDGLLGWLNSPAEEGVETAKNKISNVAGKVNQSLKDASQKTAERDSFEKPTPKMIELKNQYDRLSSPDKKRFEEMLKKRGYKKDVIMWIIGKK